MFYADNINWNNLLLYVSHLVSSFQQMKMDTFYFPLRLKRFNQFMPYLAELYSDYHKYFSLVVITFVT
jgi:hypothetical protein